MDKPKQPNYRVYLQDDRPSLLMMILMILLSLLSILGIPVMVVGSIDIYLRDRDLKLALLLIVAGLGYFAFGYFFAWPLASRLVHKWRNIANVYIAITDNEFIYQDYDELIKLQKHTIPIKNILDIGFEATSSGPDPGSQLIHIHYLDDQSGEKKVLDLNYFFGASKWRDRSLLDLLKHELRD